jgi:hypothetical protein
VNRHRLASDPDTNFHFDGDTDPYPIASFTHVGKSEFFLLLLFTGVQFLVGEKGSYFSKMGQYIEIYWKKYSLALHIWLKWIWIQICHCRSAQIRIYNTARG